MSEIFDITSFSLDDDNSYDVANYYDGYADDGYVDDGYADDGYDSDKCVTQNYFVNYFNQFNIAQDFYDVADEIINSSFIGDRFDSKKCVAYNLNMGSGIITDRYTQLLVNNNYLFPSDVYMIEFPSIIPSSHDKKLLMRKEILPPNKIYDFNIYRGNFIVNIRRGGEYTYNGYVDWIPHSELSTIQLNLWFYQTFFSQTEAIYYQENVDSLDGKRVYWNLEEMGGDFLRDLFITYNKYNNLSFPIIPKNHISLRTEQMGCLIHDLSVDDNDLDKFELEGFEINENIYHKNNLPRNYVIPAYRNLNIFVKVINKNPFVTIHCEGINPQNIRILDFNNKYEMIKDDTYSILFYGYGYMGDENYDLYYYDIGAGYLMRNKINLNGESYTVFNDDSSEAERWYGSNMRISTNVYKSWYGGFDYAIPTNVRLRNIYNNNKSVAYLIIPAHNRWNDDWEEKGRFFTNDDIINECYFVSGDNMEPEM